jgi:hypothetical protein
MGPACSEAGRKDGVERAAEALALGRPKRREGGKSKPGRRGKGGKKENGSAGH